MEAIAEIAQSAGICRVTDLARRFGVSHVTVSRIVARLQELGLVCSEPYRAVRLSDSGRKLARRSRRRHEIVYQFLLSIGVPEGIAAIDAEGIEHHVSGQTVRIMARQVREGRSQARGR